MNEMRAAIDQLSAPQQVILELYYGDGLSERAIAKRLDKSRSWVHQQRHEALAQLRRQLGTAEEGAK